MTPSPHNAHSGTKASVPEFVPYTGQAGPEITADPTQRVRRRIKYSVGALALAALLAGGGALVVTNIQGTSSPENVVQAYLQALVAGDAEAALAIANPDIPAGNRMLLNNDIYRKAANRLDGFVFERTSFEGDKAVVGVQLRQKGNSTSTTFTLVKFKPTLLNNNWKMSGAGPSTLAVTTRADPPVILVNGVEVTLSKVSSDGSGNYSVPAFPGKYEVSVPLSATQLAAAPATADVSINPLTMPVRVRLDQQTTEALGTAPAQQAGETITGCNWESLQAGTPCPVPPTP